MDKHEQGNGELPRKENGKRRSELGSILDVKTRSMRRYSTDRKESTDIDSFGGQDRDLS